MNKMEVNIIVNDLSNYKDLRRFLKKRKITILGEYFPGEKTLMEDSSYFCNIEVLVTLEDYQALSDSDIDVSFILNTTMSFPLMDDLNNLPFIKKYMLENYPDPEKESHGNEKYWEERLAKIDTFLNASHLFMLKMFKKNKESAEHFINTKVMSTKDKLQELNGMIRYFEGDPKDIETQRYEDCAFLKKMKKRILKNEANKTKKPTKRNTPDLSS